MEQMSVSLTRLYSTVICAVVIALSNVQASATLNLVEFVFLKRICVCCLLFKRYLVFNQGVNYSRIQSVLQISNNNVGSKEICGGILFKRANIFEDNFNYQSVLV